MEGLSKTKSAEKKKRVKQNLYQLYIIWLIFFLNQLKPQRKLHYFILIWIIGLW